MKVLLPGKKKPVTKAVMLIVALSVLLSLKCAQLFASGDQGIHSSRIQRLQGTSSSDPNTAPLNINSSAEVDYVNDNPESKIIQHIISLSVIEETQSYLASNFSATVTVKIEYGHNSVTENSLVNQTLTVGYSKDAGASYKARDYISMKGWEKVKVTVTGITPTTVGSLDIKNLLRIENEMRVTSYYELATAISDPVLKHIAPGGTDVPDALAVTWSWASGTNNNYTQLEWSWVEDESAGFYSGLDDIFKRNATRVDLPVSISNYTIPLFYDGKGKLYYRIRPVSVKNSGSRTDGTWFYSTNGPYIFNGHNNNLNWQVTTSFAEEGKRKTVMTYYDGSLRSRQTVTKDNSTNTTVTSETMYDGQGRPAIQILPAPGIDNVIAYRKGLNLFNGVTGNMQDITENPADYFDLQPLGAPSRATQDLSVTNGAAKYYSPGNAETNNGNNKMIPNADGYPYAVTRYTPDATGRIMMQSGVGEKFKMGGENHETKYYYGSPSQEELDGLFGTEVGNSSHYFKNMVVDANGQASVSYVDMHGRTIATALTGDAPTGMQALDNSRYVNQGGSTITRDLLNSNAIKNNTIESINSLLVPVAGSYNFNYQLTPKSLQLQDCNSTNICYDCAYDLEISITDESGETLPIIKKYSNVSLTPDYDCSTAAPSFKNLSDNTVSNNISFTQLLQPGSYSIRKTLTVSETSLETFKKDYLQKALCKTQEQLIDSVYSILQTATGCNITNPPPALDCASCKTALGTQAQFKQNYIASMGTSVPTDVEIDAAYKRALEGCNRLCPDSAHRLETIRQQMTADMIPYSGQYANSLGAPNLINEAGLQFPRNTMYPTYDIFPSNAYRNPWNESKQSANYLDEDGNIDQGIMSKLSNTSPDDFTKNFSYSWANALLPHHPEFDKLKYAENNLSTSYKWADKFLTVNTFSDALSAGYVNDPIASDPFFALNTTARSSMITYVTSSWRSTSSGARDMWEVAYMEVVCGNAVEPGTGCPNVPKTPAAGSYYSLLTTQQKDNIWNAFKTIYIAEREQMVVDYINSHVSMPNASTLVSQGYILRFPANNSQAAQQYNWTWYPQTTGPITGTTLPGVTMENSVASTYTGRCSSYIEGWKTTLLNCPNVAGNPAKDQILTQITTRMEALCQKGTDESNPYGASTLPDGVTMSNGDISFEQIINSVLSAYGITKDMYCNPYVIEFPKPYGKGPRFTQQVISVIAKCNCDQFAKISTAATAAGYDPTNLTSLNTYLQAKYGETISQELFSGLQHCVEFNTQTSFISNDIRESVVANEMRLGRGDNNEQFVNLKDESLLAVGSPRTTYTLTTAQPLPPYLACGYIDNDTRCLSCKSLATYSAAFKTVFPSYASAPTFGSGNLTDEQVNQNILFAKYVNFKSGLQLSWTDYAKAVTDAGCDINANPSTAPITNIICGDTRPLNDPTGIFTSESPCQATYNMAVAIAVNIYEKRKIQVLADFDATWRQKCMGAKDEEVFTVTYNTKEYHYTLYYYDLAGNLVKTVPPKGVRPNFSNHAAVTTARTQGTDVLMPHVLVTQYRYNSLNQVVAQRTPDAGNSLFWYDRLGRLVLSQNAKQASTTKYSYTQYDALGRVTEVGELSNTNAITDGTSKNDASLTAWMNAAVSSKNQITKTAYDLPKDENGTVIYQANVRSRVSWTAVFNSVTDMVEPANYSSATFYSYDAHGNVDVLLQDYKQGVMASAGNNLKKIAYQYDLISNKVNYVIYQPDEDPAKGLEPYKDKFYHRYLYDAENRITDVLTSSDSIYWETDATYQYYKHGPLSRTELGKLKVQGIDYVYTLQGWLKALNPSSPGSAGGGTCSEGSAPDDLTITDRPAGAPAQYVGRNSVSLGEGFINGANDDYFDVLVDGSLAPCGSIGGNYNTTDGLNGSIVARDAYTVVLNYYEGDYKPINTTSPSTGMNAQFGSNFRPLFNGNISSMAVNIGKLNSPMAYAYQYDQLNRLVSMNAYKSNNENWESLTTTTDYNEQISYDPNGNIIRYQRNGNLTATPLMDNMSYAYDYFTATGVRKSYIPDQPVPTDASRLTNRLNFIDDGVADGIYAGDIDKQNTDNYTYDEIGNLIHDTKENINSVEWTVYGKISKITKTDGTVIAYTYDAAGNRISKAVTKSSVTTTTWYVRDASGNVMCTYLAGDNTVNSGHLTQVEIDLYGSSRLGLVKSNSDVTLGAGNKTALAEGKYAYRFNFIRGNKFFELANHLGNVLSTVSDKKLQHSSDNTSVDYYNADVISASDYAPFGMQMVGRSISSDTYRYGFNGKENDNEVKGTANQQDYGMRIYDPRAGRFLSVDPITKEYPELTPYQFASNTPMQSTDLDGEETLHYTRGALVRRIEGQIFLSNHNAAEIQSMREVAYRREAMYGISEKRSELGVAKQLNYYEAQLHENYRRNRNAELGIPNDGSRPVWYSLAENKKFERAGTNLIIPLAEQLFLEGAGRFIRPLRVNPFMGLNPGDAGRKGEQLMIEHLMKKYAGQDVNIIQQVQIKMGSKWMFADAVVASKTTGSILEIAESKYNKSVLSSGQELFFLEKKAGVFNGKVAEAEGLSNRFIDPSKINLSEYRWGTDGSLKINIHTVYNGK